MIEILISLGCAFGNNESCVKGGQAYYSYSGLEKQVNEFTARHAYLAYVSSIAGIIKEQKVIVPVYRNHSNAIDLEAKSDSGILKYSMGF